MIARLRSPDEEEYVLGTHEAELERLGLQHRLWGAAAYRCWERAGIGPGTTVLDVGCGPGFASADLAALVGPTGRVLAIDESRRFVDAVRERMAALHFTNVDARVMDVQRIALDERVAHAAYARWVLCFVEDPEAVIRGVVRTLRPGGVFAVQDYVNWSTLQVSPAGDVMQRVVAAVLRSWREHGGDPNIAQRLPGMMLRHGLRIRELRPLQRVARPGSPLWSWPETFFRNYVPTLVDRGLLTPSDQKEFEQFWAERSREETAFFWAPAMMEIIAVKEGV